MNPEQTQQNNESLNKLSQQFTRWRQARLSRKERIPDELLDQALTLTRSLRRKSVVLKTLGLNHAQLKHHEQAKMPRTVQPPPIEFVQLSSPPCSSNAPTVHLTRQDGHKMTLSDLNTEQLSQVISCFMQSVVQEVSSCCS